MRPPLRIDPKIVSNRRGIGSCILVTKKNPSSVQNFGGKIWRLSPTDGLEKWPSKME